MLLSSSTMRKVDLCPMCKNAFSDSQMCRRQKENMLGELNVEH